MRALGKLIPLLRSATVGATPRSDKTGESYQAAMADELAVAVEHVLNSRYARGHAVDDASSRPRGVVPKVTAESLLEELAAARRSRGGQPQAALSRADDVAGVRPSGSSLTGLFACVAVLVILLALGVVSPLRDYVPSPLRDYLPTKDSVTRLLTGG